MLVGNEIIINNSQSLVVSLCECNCGYPVKWNKSKKQWNRFAYQKCAAKVLGLSKRNYPAIIPNHHLCGCGFCDILIDSNRIYAVGHNTKRNQTIIPNHHLCGCGKCNILVSSNRKYAHGHNARHIKHNHNGEKNPFYGKRHKRETINTISKTLINKYDDIDHFNLGRKHPKESSENHSKAAKKRWLDTNYSESVKKTLSIVNSGEGNPMFGIHLSADRCEKHSILMVNKWQDPEYVEKQRISRAIRPNKPETNIRDLYVELLPNEYRYTGDFSFTINGRCPDFVCESKRKCVELYGDYWHQGEDPQNRINMFKGFGWDCLVIWEHELKDIEAVKRKLMEFHNK